NSVAQAPQASLTYESDGASSDLECLGDLLVRSWRLLKKQQIDKAPAAIVQPSKCFSQGLLLFTFRQQAERISGFGADPFQYLLRLIGHESLPFPYALEAFVRSDRHEPLG